MRYKGINWETVRLRKQQAAGRVEGMGTVEKDPLARLFEANGDRNTRLAEYLRHGPSGERDVEPILRRMERARGTWLREVLDACED